MRFHPITLGVKRTNWSKTTMSNPGATTAELDKARHKIMLRDEFTCQCCGFQPPGPKTPPDPKVEMENLRKKQRYQLLLYLDGDERNVSDQNCLTTCAFCHQCFDLSEVEKLQSGMLIWLPEIGQAALHHIMRSLYVGRAAQGPIGAAARQLIDQFYEREKDARKRLGSSDPSALAMVLRDFLSNKQYEKASQQLNGLRLMPLDRRMVPDHKDPTFKVNEFGQALSAWTKEGPFQKGIFGPEQWPTMIFNDIRKAG